MKRAFSLCAAALMLTLALPVSALAAETAAVCYPTSVTRTFATPCPAGRCGMERSFRIHHFARKAKLKSYK